VTEKETTIYALINKIDPPWVECPYIYGQTRDEIRKWLYKLEEDFPGFHKKVINKYLRILNKLKISYKKTNRINLKPCKYCGYPTSREMCRACEIKLILLGHK
ncbi:MAG TPA: TIGR00269 family protein, partial [Candidatus Nanopusillus sp.]|nr:TIGR00269 family protein [Candidatus Nanopusillus sp.]